MVIRSHGFVKRTFSLKVSKNQGYKLSHKMAKNTFMALLLITGVIKTYITNIKMMFCFSFHL